MIKIKKEDYSQIINTMEKSNKEELTIRLDKQLIKKIMDFMQLFMCETLVKRTLSMILLVAGLPNARITELTGHCDRSVRTLRKAIKNGNTDILFIARGSGRKSKLKDVEEAVIEELNHNNYHTKQQIADMILEKHGIKVSLPAIGRLLKKNGITRLKCGSLPAKADTEKQRAFFDTVLHPLMNQAKNGKITLLFVDASHFVMGSDFLGYIYGMARRFIKTYSGRIRYNVLGAFNFISKKVTVVTNDTYITASEISDLFMKVSLEYAGKIIYLVLDNARYQKCRVVQELAAELGIHLVYIPPYSPNLNLIERFWKHVKNRLRTKYYDCFGLFREKIDSIVSSAAQEDKAIIDKLINIKVQLFDDLIPINGNTFACRKDRSKSRNHAPNPLPMANTFISDEDRGRSAA